MHASKKTPLENRLALIKPFTCKALILRQWKITIAAQNRLVWFSSRVKNDMFVDAISAAKHRPAHISAFENESFYNSLLHNAV